MLKQFVALAALALAAAPAAFAQNANALIGHWTGMVTEDGEIPQYTLSVYLNVRRDGQLVGTVRYDAFPCAGVWSNANFTGGKWTFEETVTDNAGKCVPSVDIELTPAGDLIDIRLRQAGTTRAWSTGKLARRP